MTNQGSDATYSLWKKSLLLFNSNYKEVKIPSTGDGLFFIYSLQDGDQGMYKCRATYKSITIQYEFKGGIMLPSKT